MATREVQQKGIWIGKGTPPLPDYTFSRFINPEGRCRCGNQVKYKECHMKSDFDKRIDLLNGRNNPYKYKMTFWEKWIDVQEIGKQSRSISIKK